MGNKALVFFRGLNNFGVQQVVNVQGAYRTLLRIDHNQTIDFIGFHQSCSFGREVGRH